MRFFREYGVGLESIGKYIYRYDIKLDIIIATKVRKKEVVKNDTMCTLIINGHINFTYDEYDDNILIFNDTIYCLLEVDARLMAFKSKFNKHQKSFIKSFDNMMSSQIEREYFDIRYPQTVFNKLTDEWNNYKKSFEEYKVYLERLPNVKIVYGL